MKLSVAICTWNRADMLAEMLEHLTLCNKPVDAEWEVVVVNNNSTDHTDAVIQSFVGRLPIVRVWQAVPGKSNACNAAMHAVTGDYILWTDDDVFVDANWLRSYESAIEMNPHAAFFGGTIRAHYDVPPPDWLEKNIEIFETAFALRELGDCPFDLNGSVLPFGANWAVRTSEQRRVAYDPKLGRQPAAINLGGEETLVMEQMLALGAQGVWAPGAIVNHRIPAARQTIDYLKRYYFGNGMTEAVLSPSNDVSKLLGMPRWMIKVAIFDAMNYYWKRGTAGAEVWGAALKIFYSRLGYLKAMRSISQGQICLKNKDNEVHGRCGRIGWVGAGGKREL